MYQRDYKNNNCPKAGIKIRQSDNDYKDDPFITQSKLTKPVSFQNTTLNTLDLDLDNYSLDDLYHLFNINGNILNDETMKLAKQIVLKMHPDKSQLDSKYFLFFSKAYKRLYGIYEFQNKSSKKKMDLENPTEQGYGDWLKSDEGFISVNENVTKGNMNDVFEQKKKQIQSLTLYTGVTDMVSSSFGGSLLDGGNDFSSDNYTDLKQAYTETLIPVTEEDYNKMQKFNNISEYKRHRDQVDTTPLTKEDAERKLLQQQQDHDQHSAALAFKYAKESEKAKEKQNNFWSDLKQIMW